MRTLLVLLIAVTLPLGLAHGKGKPTMTAPASAKIGSTIHVTAKNLKRARYAVRIFAKKSPNPDWICEGTVVAQAKKAATHIDVRGRIPKRLGCHSGFPASDEGTIATAPGTYSIAVSVPSSISTTAAFGSDQIRTIKLR